MSRGRGEGALVVSRGGQVSYLDGHVERWEARLRPQSSVWSPGAPVVRGTLGIVVWRLPPRRAAHGRMSVWSFVVVDLHVQGWMCDEDGWERA